MKVTVQWTDTPSQNAVNLHEAEQGIYREKERAHMVVVVWKSMVLFFRKNNLESIIPPEECTDRELIPLRTRFTLTFSTMED